MAESSSLYLDLEIGHLKSIPSGGFLTHACHLILSIFFNWSLSFCLPNYKCDEGLMISQLENSNQRTDSPLIGSLVQWARKVLMARRWSVHYIISLRSFFLACENLTMSCLIIGLCAKRGRWAVHNSRETIVYFLSSFHLIPHACLDCVLCEGNYSKDHCISKEINQDLLSIN